MSKYGDAYAPKFLVRRKPPFILRICEQQPCNDEIQDFTMALPAQEVSGTIEKQAACLTIFMEGEFWG